MLYVLKFCLAGVVFAKDCFIEGTVQYIREIKHGIDDWPLLEAAVPDPFGLAGSNCFGGWDFGDGGFFLKQKSYSLSNLINFPSTEKKKEKN